MNKICTHLLKKSIIIVALLCTTTSLWSQSLMSKLSPEEVENFKGQAEFLVRFLEGSLNDLAGQSIMPKEKQIIINETYLKFFKDNKVQIEDDLDESRKIIINKDVQAYLKDVDFFFKKATFEFAVEDAELLENVEKGFLYIKIKTTRILKATTITNEEVNSTKTRYIEINIDQETKDMKIASIYSIKISEEDELREWWRSLSNSWRIVFKPTYILGDSITYPELQKYANIEEVDLSGNNDIMHIIPLGRLRKLKKIRINRTTVKDIEPLRNLLHIESLECSNTQIADISSLKYLQTLKELDLSSTAISDLSSLKDLYALQKIDISHTPVNDITVLQDKKELQSLDCSNTYIKDLTAISKMQNLNSLQCAGTQITSLTPLAALTSLEYFNCQKTNINSLKAIEQLPNLKKLYCAETRVPEAEINSFIVSHPECLVVYKSKALIEWWNGLNKNWQEKFMQYQKIGTSPNKEQLHKLINIKHIDISNSNIIDLSPLSYLQYLKEVNCENTGVSELSPLKNLVYLEQINCSNTKINNISPLKELSNLRILNVANTQISDLSPVAQLNFIETVNCNNTQVGTVKPFEKSSSIRKLYLDNTKVAKTEIEKLRELNPACFVVYQTTELQQWWNGLNKGWKQLFGEYIKTGKSPSAEQLQQIVDIKKIAITEDYALKNLIPLTKLQQLIELNIVGADIASLAPLADHSKLEVLVCSNCRIRSLAPLSKLTKLKILECENTALRSIKGIENNKNLQKISISGSKVRMLSPVKDLKNLQYLDCSNSKVLFLSAISGHKKLTQLNCFNTNLLRITVNKYAESNKKCKIRYY